MPGSRVSELGGCNVSVPGRSPRTRATNHSPSLNLCCLPTQPCALHPPSFAKSQLSALPPGSPGCWPGKEQGRDDGEQHQHQPWCRSKHPTHPPPDFILFPSRCLATYHSRAFYSPQLQPRRAPGQLPAVAPLTPCQQPWPAGGMDDIPGVPAVVQQEESSGCGGRQIIKP